MAILPVYTVPHPKLKEVAKPVTELTDAIRAFIADLVDTMYAEDGIGLAATQVGVPLRVVVIDQSEVSEERKQTDSPYASRLLHIINPVFVWSSEETATVTEGCLSVPEVPVDITRPVKVRMRFRDLEWQEHEVEAEGLLARCFQHECDHVDGVTIADRVPFIKREQILRKVAKALRERQESAS